ncbi:hypothetical protein STEG23_014879, partial [Scotinomys teguina]
EFHKKIELYNSPLCAEGLGKLQFCPINDVLTIHELFRFIRSSLLIVDPSICAIIVLFIEYCSSKLYNELCWNFNGNCIELIDSFWLPEI